MINMNIVPNDLLSITKLFKNIFIHTTHWSHKNQALNALKQWKTIEMLLLFHSHVSHVSWSCCIVLTSYVPLKWVAHVALGCCTLFISQKTTLMKYTVCCKVLITCFMWYMLMNGWIMLMFMKCKCNYASLTPGVLQYIGGKPLH